MVEKSIPPLREHQLKRAQHVRSAYCVKVEHGVTMADVLSKNYWRQVGEGLRVGDLIEVRSDDGSIDADLRVIAIDRSTGPVPDVTVRALRIGFADEVDVIERPAADPMPSIGWGGLNQMWRIMRGPVIVEANIETKEIAEAKLAALLSKDMDKTILAELEKATNKWKSENAPVMSDVRSKTHSKPTVAKPKSRPPTTDPNPRVAWGGPAHKWRLMRGTVIVEANIETKEIAEAKLAELAA